MKKKNNWIDEWDENWLPINIFFPSTINLRKGGAVAQQRTTNGAPMPTNGQANPAQRPQSAVKPQTTSFSIKDAMQKKEEVKKVTQEESFAESSERNAFTQDDLIKAWNNYLQFTTGQPVLQQTIQQCKPVQGTDFKIMLAVYNSAQESLMTKERVKITNYLRKELHNGQISLEIRIYEMNENMKSLTHKELFLKMMENNPNLKKLAKELNLELA